MVIDKVHDLQRAFRAMVTAHSFPGRIVTVAEEMAKVDSDLILPPHLVLPALTLMDAETPFTCMLSDADAAQRLLSQLTYARPVTPDSAAFLFIGDSPEVQAAAFETAREGTLENPHLGATLIMESSSLEPLSAADADRWVLCGPGVKSETSLALPGSAEWIPMRNHRNREFPLGIDIILVDSAGRLVALPRSTRITQEAA